MEVDLKQWNPILKIQQDFVNEDVLDKGNQQANIPSQNNQITLEEAQMRVLKQELGQLFEDNLVGDSENNPDEEEVLANFDFKQNSALNIERILRKVFSDPHRNLSKYDDPERIFDQEKNSLDYWIQRCNNDFSSAVKKFNNKKMRLLDTSLFPDHTPSNLEEWRKNIEKSCWKGPFRKSAAVTVFTAEFYQNPRTILMISLDFYENPTEKGIKMKYFGSGNVFKSTQFKNDATPNVEAPKVVTQKAEITKVVTQTIGIDQNHFDFTSEHQVLNVQNILRKVFSDPLRSVSNFDDATRKFDAKNDNLDYWLKRCSYLWKSVKKLNDQQIKLYDFTGFKDQSASFLRDWVIMLYRSSWKGPFKKPNLTTFTVEYTQGSNTILLFGLDFHSKPGKECVGLSYWYSGGLNKLLLFKND